MKYYSGGDDVEFRVAVLVIGLFLLDDDVGIGGGCRSYDAAADSDAASDAILGDRRSADVVVVDATKTRFELVDGEAAWGADGRQIVLVVFGQVTQKSGFLSIADFSTIAARDWERKRRTKGKMQMLKIL